MAGMNDPSTMQTLDTLKSLHVPHQLLSTGELESKFPQINFDRVAWGLFEPESGALLARQAVQVLVNEAVHLGVDYRVANIRPHSADVSAGVYVYACGPWLPKIFPELLAQKIFPSRQEVFFFGVPEGSAHFAPPAMPTWINFSDETYGIPDLESRGFKVAFDTHGPAFDPETGVRMVTPEGAAKIREYVAMRFPALHDAPIVETRVCQYENTSNGDFLIDRHPSFDNVWLVGGGSGHGFKHGPALGDYVARLITEGGAVEPRFLLAAKGSVQQRAIY
jgi:glycine/D-amino acid oxidase-like deaminating enzyme